MLPIDIPALNGAPTAPVGRPERGKGGTAPPRVAGTRPDLRPAHLPGALLHPGSSPPTAPARPANRDRPGRRGDPACPDRGYTVSDLARLAGTSARSLHYAFHEQYGTTPARYLRQVRLDRETRGPGPGPRHGRRHRLLRRLHQPQPLRPRLPRPLRRVPRRHPQRGPCLRSAPLSPGSIHRAGGSRARMVGSSADLTAAGDGNRARTISLGIGQIIVCNPC